MPKRKQVFPPMVVQYNPDHLQESANNVTYTLQDADYAALVSIFAALTKVGNELTSIVKRGKISDDDKRIMSYKFLVLSECITGFHVSLDELLTKLSKDFPDMLVIMLTVHGTVDTGEAMSYEEARKAFAYRRMSTDDLVYYDPFMNIGFDYNCPIFKLFDPKP